MHNFNVTCLLDSLFLYLVLVVRREVFILLFPYFYKGKKKERDSLLNSLPKKQFTLIKKYINYFLNKKKEKVKAYGGVLHKENNWATLTGFMLLI